MAENENGGPEPQKTESKLKEPVLLDEYLKDKAGFEGALSEIDRQFRASQISLLILSTTLAGVIILCMTENRKLSALAEEVANLAGGASEQVP